MRISIWLATAAALFNAACGREMKPEFKAFDLNHQDTSGSPVDMRFLLDAPAGKDGFLTVRDGRLTTPGGRRLRIWGVNTSFSGSLPAKEDAPRYADLLARYGVNCIRVHHCDRPFPRGLIDDSGGTTRKLHPEALDRLDFFVSELKTRGIYTNLNLNVSRPFTEADGVKDAGKIGYGKGLTYFDPKLIELQKEYARQLLSHRNPYTGNEYRQEPAIAIVEMINENSILESWMRGRLWGRQTTPTRTTWTDIPPSYAADLTRLYNSWLRKERPELLPRLRKEAGVGAGEEIPRLAPDQCAAASAERFHAEADFYISLEQNFFRMMEQFLKKELGAGSLVVGTSAHSGSLSPYPLLASTSLLDAVDGHTYWQHPSQKRDPATGATTSWSIRNTPMVNEPLTSTILTLGRNAVAGKPYTVSEVNHPYPAEYAAEGIPVLAAYGALHDWDGIFHYSFSHAPPSEWKPGPAGHFDIRNDPVKMTQVAAGALIFLRGDVSVAKETLRRSFSHDQVIETLRMPGSEAPLFDPNCEPALMLMHSTRIESFDGKPTEFPGESASPIRSDTGELAWYHSPAGKGLVVADTPRTQALVGFIKANAVETTHLKAEIANDFAAITLHALDGKPIADADRLLLATGARVAATGMKWDAERTTLLEPGGPPMTIETVVGTITLKGLRGAAALSVSPLDGAGKPRGRFEALLSFSIDPERASPWYLIEVKR